VVLIGEVVVAGSFITSVFLLLANAVFFFSFFFFVFTGFDFFSFVTARGALTAPSVLLQERLNAIHAAIKRQDVILFFTGISLLSRYSKGYEKNSTV
jgi:hypothetical protein